MESRSLSAPLTEMSWLFGFHCFNLLLFVNLSLILTFNKYHNAYILIPQWYFVQFAVGESNAFCEHYECGMCNANVRHKACKWLEMVSCCITYGKVFFPRGGLKKEMAQDTIG